MAIKSAAPRRGPRRALGAALLALGVVSVLAACERPSGPRTLELGDVLGVGGTQLLGLPAAGVPLSDAWAVRVEPPRIWLVDPRDAVAVSVRVGLRWLDVFARCQGEPEHPDLPQDMVVDGVQWSIDVVVDGALVLQAVTERMSDVRLVAESEREPNGALRYLPSDSSAASRALSLGVSVDEFPDARAWLDRIARGATAELRLQVVLNVAGAADLADCTVLIAELGCQGTTVWLAAGRP